MPSPFHGPRTLVAAVTVAAAAALLPSPARAAVPELALVVSDIQAGPAGPTAPWTYLGMQASADWRGLLHDTRLEIDSSGLEVATVFVPSVGNDGTIRPDTHQCRTAGAVTTCALGDRAPTSWFPLPFLVVQAAPGAPAGRSGTLRITVTGTTETGAPVGPVVATPAVTVVR